MKLIEYADTEMMMIDLANTLAGEINAALTHEDRVSVALPGGRTPGPLYDDLCGTSLDWDRVRILPTDERLVGPDHPRSNEGMLRARLLTGAAAQARFVGLRPGADGMAGLADRVARALPLNVLVLGMGEDMHTASLFPGAPELESALAPDAPPVMQITPPDQPEPRITLTAPVLRAALSTHILITGAAKRAALERAAALADPQRAPIALVLKGATVHWTEEE
ncbi:6-phosphogluconolactonase [Rhodovulum adriaticum]|uniref:6-phosphogluconolactonase n=1 Tax=Rhodovulum adriaticum TaxID=35804 RepID=A0A4R2NPG4_RHOAD|nr:6-phosphogluconolactonase [Rhodovulum adriaticum]MBK1634417.1 6-phosphogluconolactonase [Rhodovulum adriaticum]TCP23214.1 6-phosphogluconolactonase [Rhodovulum adriaticum]